MIKNAKGFLKGCDAFGHAVQLNFNRQGTSVNTVVGGLVSLLIYALIGAYFGFRANVMIQYDDNSIEETVTIVDLQADELQPIKMNETNILLFIDTLELRYSQMDASYLQSRHVPIEDI